MMLAGLAGRQPIQEKKWRRPGMRKMTEAPMDPTREPGKRALVMLMEMTSVCVCLGRVGGWVGELALLV